MAAVNNYGVQVNPLKLDDSANPGPNTQTYHGIIIEFNGSIVGRVQSWNPKMYSRTGEHIYELNRQTFGRAVDYVPGINESYTISCNRMELWNDELERSLGYTGAWSDLIDQDKPFTIKEYLWKGNSIYRTWTYKGCWFTNKNLDAFDAKATPTIKLSAEIAFVSRIGV